MEKFLGKEQNVVLVTFLITRTKFKYLPIKEGEAPILVHSQLAPRWGGTAEGHGGESWSQHRRQKVKGAMGGDRPFWVTPPNDPFFLSRPHTLTAQLILNYEYPVSSPQPSL